MELGPVGATIRRKLQDRFGPSSLEVIDESQQHAGHAGADARGESHFRIRLVADAFAGLGRVARHRLINTALAEELATRVHALAIEAKASGEP